MQAQEAKTDWALENQPSISGTPQLPQGPIFLELHQELIKTNYWPQMNAALQNFQTLLELNISLLIGCDIGWGGESEVAAAAAAAGTVLGASADNNNDSTDGRGAEGSTDPAGPAHGEESSAAPAAPASPAVSAVPAAPAAPAVDCGGCSAWSAAPAWGGTLSVCHCWSIVSADSVVGPGPDSARPCQGAMA
jgi:hypothetical protein